MRMLWSLIPILSTFQVVLADNFLDYSTLFGVSPRRDLNFTELVDYDGYTSEAHSVTTEDGYILGLYRVLANKYCSETKPVPIVFYHGLYLSGDDCIIPGPKKAHCYIYADNCYDVWVPNSRGNRYSRKHKTLNPDKDPEFWDFAWDEMALKDLPAVIDYVLEVTNTTQVVYIAHSQGVAMLLLLCAKEPEYNDKIKIGFGLSATAWLDHSRFIGIGVEAITAHFLDGAHNNTNVGILGHGKLVQTIGSYLCGLGVVEYPACTILLFAVLGYNNFQIKPDVLRVLPGHVPAGTSLKDFIRWGQIRNNGFTGKDYGNEDNLKIYGQKTPPEFDLSPVTMKWIFYASENDYVADVKDVKKLTDVLSDAFLCILDDKTFGHLDFIYSNNIDSYLTPNILSTVETGSGFCPFDEDQE